MQSSSKLKTHSAKLNWRGRLINGLTLYRTWYNKGINVLSVIRNMQLTDIGIMMAVAKYLFGDHISTGSILSIGAVYWILNAVVNVAVGRFWERNNGWEIEAQVCGQRVEPSRTVLVSPEGKPYDARELNIDGKISSFKEFQGWICPECKAWCGHYLFCSYFKKEKNGDYSHIKEFADGHI